MTDDAVPSSSRQAVTVPQVASPPRTATGSQGVEPAAEGSSQLDDSNLLDAVSHLQSESVIEIIKLLAFTIFSKEELKDGSISGKKSFKSGEAVRPALDQAKVGQLERLVRRKCPSVDRRVFVDKLQNVQKVLRRSAAAAKST